MKTIKTNIKFSKGLNNVENKLYGFVTRVNGSWRGCRSDEPKKKIVFVEESVADSIIPNSLYNVTLKPMNNGDGFIAISVREVKFPAQITTTVKDSEFQVKVSFGNANLIYNPFSSFEREKNIVAIANLIRCRKDLLNPLKVAEDFINEACIVSRLAKQYSNQE